MIDVFQRRYIRERICDDPEQTLEDENATKDEERNVSLGLIRGSAKKLVFLLFMVVYKQLSQRNSGLGN